jgi:hypothetical protein
LRREFIELEILAAVTNAVFDGSISFDTDGLTRPQIVAEFFKHHEPSFVPPGIHGALRWTARELIETSGEKTISPGYRELSGAPCSAW